jgi:tetratricopeptide (TPR) repeat protein
MMSGDQETFQQAMNQGHSAAWDQKWEEAARFYSQAIQVMPDNPAALTSLGMALFELNKFDKALVCYQRAAKTSPTDPLPPEKMARIYERLGQVPEAVRATLRAAELYLQARDADKAIENYIKVTSLQPDNIQAHNRLGLIYERLKHTSKAIAEFLMIASLQQRSGDLDKAAQTVEHCLELNPNSEEIETVRQAKLLLQKKQLLPGPVRSRGGTAPLIMAEIQQQAESKGSRDNTSVSQKKVQDPISETHQRALVQLASLLFEQPETLFSADEGETKGSGTSKKSKKGADPISITLHLSQAIELLTHGNEKQAIGELESTLDAGLNHASVFFILGFLYCGADEKKAIRFLQQSLRNPDYALAAYLQLGQLYRKSDNFKEATISYLRALNLADTNTISVEQFKDLNRTYESIIEAQSQQSDKDILARICDTVSAQLLRPDWKEYLRMARKQLPVQPAGTPPLPLAETLLETNSTQVVEIIGYIRKLSNQGKLDSAMEEAYFALQSAATFLPLHIEIGELLAKHGYIQDAITKFQLVAKLYHLRGETNQAINLLTNILAFSPSDLIVRTTLIDLLSSEGQYDDAVQQSLDLARNYEYNADFEKARQVYTDTLSLASRSRDARGWSIKIYYKIADIDTQRVDWHQAIRVYEQIRTLEPDDANARTQLVDLDFRLGRDGTALNEVESFITLLENSGKLPQAVEFMQNLITNWPDRLDLRKSLAELLARNNQIKTAVDQLGIVANTLMDSGDVEGTTEIVERIISLNPSNMSEYQAALAKLKGGK